MVCPECSFYEIVKELSVNECLVEFEVVRALIVQVLLEPEDLIKTYHVICTLWRKILVLVLFEVDLERSEVIDHK